MHMSKPLATLGDAIAAKGADVDWRAQARAEGIARRPPPSSERASEQAVSRPDRGFVEQPEEYVEPLKSFKPPSPKQSSPKPPIDKPLHTEPATKRLTTEEIAPFMRRRVETPTLTAPVALIRFERHASYPPPASAANDSPAPTPAVVTPAPAPEVAEVPAGVKKLAADGRRLFTPEFREKAMKAFDERPEGVIQKDVAKQFGIHQTVLSGWIAKRDAKQAAAEKERKRQATRAANKAAKSQEPERVQREVTQLSRPSPPSAPPSNGAAASVTVSKPRGVRGFDTVSLELAGAINKVAELKRELRALLGDD
jgi:transposase-like protein